MGLRFPHRLLMIRHTSLSRALGDVLGCKTEWVADERKVIYTYNDKCNGEITTLEIWIGKQIGKKNNETWDMGLAPLIVNDRTLVPLRAISEGLGADVLWEGETRKITITQN
ncbi:MAG: copper amine oxidase N-terminal domain-containing protein [Caldisericia bacterium]